VTIGIERRCNRRMTEATLDYFRMLPLGYQHRCVCVAEVVVVPTSAQARLCRRLRYADLGWAGV